MPLPMAIGVLDVGPEVPVTHRLGGGSYLRPSEEVEPGFPQFLTPNMPDIHVPTARPTSTGRCSAFLRRRLGRADHPLTARVMANRVWQHYLGRGIVASPNDFVRWAPRLPIPNCSITSLQIW